MVLVLSRLRKMYGNDWATIGQALGRSASSVKDKCRLMKETCNSGESYTYWSGGGKKKSQ
jgi:hypothetical protein